MAIPKRLTSHGTFFISAPTHERRRVFQRQANAQLFLDTLRGYANDGHLDLHAFVVMPDHVHLMFTTTTVPLERVMQYIKGGFSHRLASKLPVWQKGYTDHRIRDDEDFRTHIDYVHDNPVRARFCQRPEDYRWSSAYRQTHPSG